MFFWLGTEGSKCSLHRNDWFQCFFCLGTVDRKSVVLGKSVDLGGRRIIKKKQKVPYLEMGGSTVFLFMS